MNNKSAAARVLEKLAAAQGAVLDMDALKKLNKGSTSVSEPETVLRMLHAPHAFMMKECKRKVCNNKFETNYCGVSYCSDECLAADLREIGIVYDPFKMQRWESSQYASDSGRVYRYEPPEYLSQQVLDDLERWALNFLADLARLRNLPEPEEYRQRRQTLEEQAKPVDDWASLFARKKAEQASPPNPEPADNPPPSEDYQAPASPPEQPAEPERRLSFF